MTHISSITIVDQHGGCVLDIVKAIILLGQCPGTVLDAHIRVKEVPESYSALNGSIRLTAGILYLVTIPNHTVLTKKLVMIESIRVHI